MKQRPGKIFALSGLGLVVLLAAAAGPVVADDIYVTITADTNDGFCGGPVNFPCSLRDAILLANARAGFDVIHVPAGVYNLTIPSAGEDAGMTGDLDVLEEVMIRGEGAAETIIDAQGLDRAVHILHSGGWVYLYEMTIRGGDSSNDPSSAHGAGIASLGGAAWIELCTIEGNFTDNGHGGGLYQRQGTMNVIRSLVRDNHAHGGAGLAAYLAVVSIDASTFADNYATDFDLTGTGGAVWFADSDSRIKDSTIAENNSRLLGQPAGVFVHGGETDVVSSTLVDNDNDEIFNDPAGGAVMLNLGNLVIKGTCNDYGITTLGGNVVGPNSGYSCQFGTSDLGGRQIRLHPLGSYGGPTPTMPPVGEQGNAIIDNPNADAHCTSLDQRGINRPQDGHGSGIAVCDSGAVEYRGLIFGDSFETGSTNRWSNTSP